MNTIDPASILPGLQPVLSDLVERFETRIETVRAPRPNEVYFHAQMELVPGFCAQLYKKWNGRLVSLFADDARGARSIALPEGRCGTNSGAMLRAPDERGAAATTSAGSGVFYIYYVFALYEAHGFFILRVPVSPDPPSLRPSGCRQWWE